MCRSFTKSLFYPLQTNPFDRVSVLDGSGNCTWISSNEISSRTEDKCNKVLISLVDLNLNSVEELKWWTNNLELASDRTIIPQVAKMIVQIDASKKEWETFCKRTSMGVNGQIRNQSNT